MPKRLSDSTMLLRLVMVHTFRQATKKTLSNSVTQKVHAVMWHIEGFSNAIGMGLRPWSEQCKESIHHDFLAIWKISRSKIWSKRTTEENFFVPFACTTEGMSEHTTQL